MNIGIDIDDTISNTYETTIPYLKKYIENELKREFKIDLNEPTDYYKLTKKFDLTEEEEWNFWEKYFVSTVKEAIPKENVPEIIRRLKEDGHKIFIVTARVEVDVYDIKAITRDWLIENNIVFDELILNAHNKLEIANEKNIQVFIDDSIRNCTMLSDGGIKTYMFNTVFNDFYKNKNIEKVYSWDEFYKKVKEEI